MTAELWKLKVYKSFDDYLHGMYNEITELYLSDEGFAFNVENGVCNCLQVKTPHERYGADAKKIKDVILPQSVKDVLSWRIEMQKAMNHKNNELSMALSSVMDTSNETEF